MSLLCPFSWWPYVPGVAENVPVTAEMEIDVCAGLEKWLIQFKKISHTRKWKEISHNITQSDTFLSVNKDEIKQIIV